MYIAFFPGLTSFINSCWHCHCILHYVRYVHSYTEYTTQREQQLTDQLQASLSSYPATLFKKIDDVFSVCLVKIWRVASFNLYTLTSQEIVLQENGTWNKIELLEFLSSSYRVFQGAWFVTSHFLQQLYSTKGERKQEKVWVWNNKRGPWPWKRARIQHSTSDNLPDSQLLFFYVFNVGFKLMAVQAERERVSHFNVYSNSVGFYLSASSNILWEKRISVSWLYTHLQYDGFDCEVESRLHLLGDTELWSQTEIN